MTRVEEKNWDIHPPKNPETTITAPFLCEADIIVNSFAEFDVRYLINGKGDRFLERGKKATNIGLTKGETITIKPAKSDFTGESHGGVTFRELT